MKLATSLNLRRSVLALFFVTAARVIATMVYTEWEYQKTVIRCYDRPASSSARRSYNTSCNGLAGRASGALGHPSTSPEARENETIQFTLPAIRTLISPRNKSDAETRQNVDNCPKFWCSDEKVVMVALIVSPPERAEARHALREMSKCAHGHLPGCTAKLPSNNCTVLNLFVTWLPKKLQFFYFSLLQEGVKFNDILLGNFSSNKGTYHSTLPVLLGLRWILRNCKSARHIFVGTDELYLNHQKLLEAVVTRETRANFGLGFKKWLGRVVSKAIPNRDISSRDYVSERLYSGSKYPRFCTMDAGFVLSLSGAQDVVRLEREHPFLPLVDVFIAQIAHTREWILSHDERFTVNAFINEPCQALDVVTSHKSSYHFQGLDLLRKLSNARLLRQCSDPPVDLVLPSGANNTAYLDQALALLHNEPTTCRDTTGSKQPVFIIALISTTPENAKVRLAIRETWGAERKILNETVKIVFLIGKQNVEDIEAEIQQESDEYHDIIQANFSESFQNLTLKVILGLKWVSQYCQQALYLYKGDVDMFVNFRNIITHLKWLRSRGEAISKFFMGSRVEKSYRYPENYGNQHLKKYEVSDKLYKGKWYVPYCSGGGYIFTADVVHAMYAEALRTSLFNVDDAFQGILAKKVGALPQNNPGFKNWGWRENACALRNPDLMTIHIGHKRTEEKLRDLWRKYTDTNIRCYH